MVEYYIADFKLNSNQEMRLKDRKYKGEVGVKVIDVEGIIGIEGIIEIVEGIEIDRGDEVGAIIIREAIIKGEDAEAIRGHQVNRVNLQDPVGHLHTPQGHHHALANLHQHHRSLQGLHHQVVIVLHAVDELLPIYRYTHLN
jgi:hypothetical protein